MDIQARIETQVARFPLVTGLLMGLFGGGLALVVQLTNPEPRPWWALLWFVLLFTFGVLVARHERQRRRSHGRSTHPPGEHPS